MQKYSLKARLQTDSDPKRYEQEERNHMRERDIISAGAKLIGLFLLLLGLLEFFREGISLIIQLIAADTDDLPEGTWKILSVVAATKLGVAIFQIALGTYLCRGGRLFVELLSKKESS